MKVVTVVGARPQFVKAAMTSRALRRAGHDDVLIHTGQHYDFAMSEVFFRELGLPDPAVNLGVGSGPHGQQTGQMLAGLEEVLQGERPNWVLVFGDTNSTLAAALAACKLRLPLAHVEAGMRSFNREMPEEHNRVLTDHCSDLLLCPTQTAVDNLKREGTTRGVFLVGDTMCDALRHFAPVARERSTVRADLGLRHHGYNLATIHRASNTDDPARLRQLLTTLGELPEPTVVPLHPRTRQRLGGWVPPPAVRLVEPLGYLDMLALQMDAVFVLTDSGGVQKEAFLLGKRCVTLREETEWVETVECGWNVLAGANPEAIRDAVMGRRWPAGPPPALFGDGDAAGRIVAAIEAGVA